MSALSPWATTIGAPPFDDQPPNEAPGTAWAGPIEPVVSLEAADILGATGAALATVVGRGGSAVATTAAGCPVPEVFRTATCCGLAVEAVENGFPNGSLKRAESEEQPLSS